MRLYKDSEKIRLIYFGWVGQQRGIWSPSCSQPAKQCSSVTKAAKTVGAFIKSRKLFQIFLFPLINPSGISWSCWLDTASLCEGKH